jgi:sn-glycerol 3-phosphate transport system ATP-binding protein
MATLQLEGLRKSFGETAILQGIDLTLHHGEMLVIVGASGCGKSTLLRLVAGLETATAGRILLDDRDITRLDPASRDIAMVFQNYALYPHMTVAENMAYGLRIRGMPKDAIAARVQQTADLLGLGALLARRPRQLSGGQRQRVAMGRAIVREPKLFLFDEPLSNLDASLRVQMRAEIRQLQRRLGVTSLYVTHDQVEAMTLGDRLLVLHQGVPVQFAPPMEIFERPATTYVAGFIGAPAMNFLSAVASGDGRSARLASGHELALPQDVGRSAAVTLGIRPEHIDLAPGGLPMHVDLVEPLGSETLVHGHLADGTRLLVKQAGALPIGDALSVAFPAAALHLFGGDGRRI